MHLSSDEGTLTIDSVTAQGAEASAIVRVTPAIGFHVSTEIPNHARSRPMYPSENAFCK